MRPASKFVTWAVGVFTLANTWGPSPIGSVMAQEDSKPARSARGGELAKIGARQFEVFFYTTGLRVLLRDSAGAPIGASKLTGTATFYHPNSPQPWFERKLASSAASPGQVSESLDLAINLSTVPPSGARVAFEIAGLPDPASPTAKFTVPFQFVKASAGYRGEGVAAARAHEEVTTLREASSRSPSLIARGVYAPIATEAYYFPFAGFYSTPTGVVWVPRPGYYHAAPTQYHPTGAYAPPTDWRVAHPAPSPSAVGFTARDLSGIQTEYFWHPRAMDTPAAHEAWIRAQLRQKYGPVSGY